MTLEILRVVKHLRVERGGSLRAFGGRSPGLHAPSMARAGLVNLCTKEQEPVTELCEVLAQSLDQPVTHTSDFTIRTTSARKPFGWWTMSNETAAPRRS